MLPWLIAIYPGWDAAHFIFMGAVYSSLTILGIGLVFVTIKTIFQLKKEEH